MEVCVVLCIVYVYMYILVLSLLPSLPLILQSCRPQGVGPSVEESVAERLKQTDLGKLQKLTQRFTSPMKHGRDRHRQQNDCHFVGEEEFFHKFIVLADRYSTLCRHDRAGGGASVDAT